MGILRWHRGPRVPRESAMLSAGALRSAHQAGSTFYAGEFGPGPVWRFREGEEKKIYFNAQGFAEWCETLAEGIRKGAQLYEGEVTTGSVTGTGHMRFPECGEVFCGSFKDAKAHGPCSTEKHRTRDGLPDLQTFEGVWKEGRRHGQGAVRWKNRLRGFEGEFKHNVPTGGSGAGEGGAAATFTRYSPWQGQNHKEVNGQFFPVGKPVTLAAGFFETEEANGWANHRGCLPREIIEAGQGKHARRKREKKDKKKKKKEGKEKNRKHGEKS